MTPGPELDPLGRAQLLLAVLDEKLYAHLPDDTYPWQQRGLRRPGPRATR